MQPTADTACHDLKHLIARKEVAVCSQCLDNAMSKAILDLISRGMNARKLSLETLDRDGSTSQESPTRRLLISIEPPQLDPCPLKGPNYVEVIGMKAPSQDDASCIPLECFQKPIHSPETNTLGQSIKKRAVGSFQIDVKKMLSIPQVIAKLARTGLRMRGLCNAIFREIISLLEGSRR